MGGTLLMALLADCTQKKAVEVSLAYHPSFPKDVEVKLEKTSFSPETKSTWEMHVLGDRALLATSEMDNSDYKYAMYGFPGMDFVGYVGARSEFGRGTMVAKGENELFLKNKDGIGVYRLETDSLRKSSALDLPAGDYPVMRRLGDNVWMYENDHRTDNLCEFFMYDASSGTICACGIYPNVHDRGQFKDLRTYKGAYVHSVRVKPDGSRVLVFIMRQGVIVFTTMKVRCFMMV